MNENQNEDETANSIPVMSLQSVFEQISEAVRNQEELIGLFDA